MASSLRSVVILGSTGSIGIQALALIDAERERFDVTALAAGGGNIPLLIEQAKRFGVSVVGCARGDQALLREALPGVQVIVGEFAAEEIAAIPADVTLNAITGSIGLRPTLAALAVGNSLALANKESLVAGGSLVVNAAKPGQLIPVDSEHSALAQALRSGVYDEVSRVILTASGGPFMERSDLGEVTVDEALNHPTWNMGPVVTINSATLVNKGLEIIEAHYLFNLPYKKIDAVIHPQSIVHSMVEFFDGSVIAQASPPNMTLPISLALDWPHRIAGAIAPIDWSRSQQWEFRPVDNLRFPAINLARRCGEVGGGAPAAFNAANEEAVAAFISGRISFTDIVEIIDEVLTRIGGEVSDTLRDVDDVSAVEENARHAARERIAQLGTPSTLNTENGRA
ncbi:MAG: 1-deoxy-D-xylulose-5-phosphate reductoisomerase [Candidatus Nanopelagicaceae bacterium]